MNKKGLETIGYSLFPITCLQKLKNITENLSTFAGRDSKSGLPEYKVPALITIPVRSVIIIIISSSSRGKK
jgi:hypothetical protein